MTPPIKTVGPARLQQPAGRAGRARRRLLEQSCAPRRAHDHRVARQRPDVTVVPVDVDAELDTTRQFDVMSIPTVLVLQDGRETGRLDGLITKRDLHAALTAQPDSGHLGRE